VAFLNDEHSNELLFWKKQLLVIFSSPCNAHKKGPGNSGAFLGASKKA
jgi:hypothetical protein